MERPALVKLMNDIRDRKVDVVVVYKVDRLTRSLSDFAKIVEVFDAQGVSFVSVTQQFNTTTSMGRLTLNVLLSFAQFEREVTGERIRDKIAASKKKGMFMGGGFPLGYDLNDHRLVVNDDEAKSVRTIFDRYVELRSVRHLQVEVRRLGIVTKVRTSESGRTWGGGKLTRGHLYYVLQNRTYIGEIFHKGQIYAGLHDAIVDRGVWDQVQEILASNLKDRSGGKNFTHPSPLTGILFDDRGNRLTPSHSTRGSVRRRYYVCQAIQQNKPDEVGSIRRLPAPEIEALVVQQVRGLLTRSAELLRHLVGDEAKGEVKQTILTAATTTKHRIDRDKDKSQIAFVRAIVRKIVAGAEAVVINIDRASLMTQLGVVQEKFGTPDRVESRRGEGAGEFAISIPIRLTRSGRQKRMIIADGAGIQRIVNDGMVMAVARAVTWDQDVRSGMSLREIAKRENLSAGYVTRIMPLAFLAPDIVQAIYEGRQPAGLKVKALSANLPLDWIEQRRTLGFSAR